MIVSDAVDEIEIREDRDPREERVVGLGSYVDPRPRWMP